MSCTVKHLRRIPLVRRVVPIDPIFEEEGAQKGAQLRNVFYVVGQHFIDERLVSQIPALRFLPKLVDHSRIESDRNKLTRLLADRRTSDAPHRAELLSRSLWNIR